MLPIRTILHATDFSERSKMAFDLAVSLARDYAARLVLLHVRQPVVGAWGEFGYIPPDARETPEVIARRLQELSADAKVSVERQIAEGDAAEAILHAARETQCDLIVIGTHGRTGLGRLLMGSVAEQVLRKAPCPVLTVKTPFAKAAPALRARPAAAKT